MYTFLLDHYDRDGNEVRTTWDVLPVDRDPAFRFIRLEKGRATGSARQRPFAIKEVWTLTFGAGTLANADHRDKFFLLLQAHRITWVRKYGHKTDSREFELETDTDVTFDYLQSKRTLKRKALKFVEAEPNYYDTFDEFRLRYEAIVADNGLW